MRGASGTALQALDKALDQVLDGVSGQQARSNLAGRLFDVVDLLDAELSLRRVLADASMPAETKGKLVDELLGKQLTGPALDLLKVAVAERWSRPIDLVDGLETQAVAAVFASAEAAGALDDVEDELFRFGRIVDAESDLHAALVDPAGSVEAKRELVVSLLDNRARAATRDLAVRAATKPRGRTFDRALESWLRLAATRRSELVAEVTVAEPLSDKQRADLERRLSKLYGRKVVFQVVVDADLLGGIVVRIDDEVIDGSIATRLARARRRIAG